MNTYDPNLHEQQRKLEAIEARLAGHEKMARLSLLWLSTLGFVVLALLAMSSPACRAAQEPTSSFYKRGSANYAACQGL